MTIKGKLTNTSFTDISWEKLKQCSEIRQDNIYDTIKTRWNEGPRGGYHRACYQEYTHKHKLDRIQRKRKSETETAHTSTSTYDEPSTKRTSRSSVPGPDLEKCILCQCERTKTDVDLNAYGRLNRPDNR